MTGHGSALADVLFTADITCQTPACANHERVLNTVVITRDPDLSAEETENGFHEGWRGEDPADKCPQCGQIGLLQDPRYPERLTNPGPLADGPLPLQQRKENDMSESYDIHDGCEEIPEEGYEFPESHAASQPSGPPVEVPPPTEPDEEPAEEAGLAAQVAELRGQMTGVLDRLATVERDLAAIRRVEVSPPPRILDVSMMPTREEMEGVRGLVDKGLANGNGSSILVPALQPSPTPPPVMTEAPMPNTPNPDEAAGSAVRQLLRAAGIPFTQVRVRWEMNERRAAVYLDRDAVMDMLTELPEGGASFAEIVEWGEAICHALAATPHGGRVEEMKWFPYSRDDDAWWGAKVLIPHLGL